MKCTFAVTVIDHSRKQVDQIISKDFHKVFKFISSDNSRDCLYGFCVTDRMGHEHVGTYRTKELLTESINEYLANH